VAAAHQCAALLDFTKEEEREMRARIVEDALKKDKIPLIFEQFLTQTR
jgi:hypothetical protein